MTQVVITNQEQEMFIGVIRERTKMAGNLKPNLTVNMGEVTLKFVRQDGSAGSRYNHWYRTEGDEPFYITPRFNPHLFE